MIKEMSFLNTPWDTASIGSLCLETTLADPTKSPDASFEYVDVSSVSNELLKIMATTRHTGATAPSRARKVVREGDVIFATVRPTLKRVAIVPPELDRHIVSTAFCVLRADPTKADGRFIYYSLLTEDFMVRVSNLERGASYPAITDNDILRQEILLPTLPEQRAIAAVLGKIQAAMEVQDKLVATLKELKAATMAKLFREGLRGERLKQTEIGEIPESWEVVRLDALAELVSGGTPSKARPEWWKGSIPWASPKDMKRPRLWDTHDHVTEEAITNGSRLVSPKTIFVVIRGMILAKYVPVAITEVPMAFNQDMKAVIPKPTVNADFLFYAIRSRTEALSKAISTSAHGTRRMGTSSVEELLVPLPTKQEEQHAIARTLQSLEEQEETSSKKRDGLKALFSSMLHLLMTGQVRVKDPQVQQIVSSVSTRT